MCIGLPMEVIGVEPGHALCVRRGEQRRVRTALVGDVKPGEWLLIFLDSAQERLCPQRAEEIDATLDLLNAALYGAPQDDTEVFALPSRMTREQLIAMAGAASPAVSSSPEPSHER